MCLKPTGEACVNSACSDCRHILVQDGIVLFGPREFSVDNCDRKLCEGGKNGHVMLRFKCAHVWQNKRRHTSIPTRYGDRTHVRQWLCTNPLMYRNYGLWKGQRLEQSDSGEIPVEQTRDGSVDPHRRQCSFYPRRLGPAHRDSGKPGYASTTHWPGKQSKHQEGEARRACGTGAGSGRSPTCTMLLMTWGSMFRGNRRMLKSESDTKAFSASRTLFSSTVTYTANVVNATWGGKFWQNTSLERDGK